MSSINLPQISNRKPGIKRMKRHAMKIDMTPMVDLGYLLITFFVMTIEMSKPSSIGLVMPNDGIDGARLKQSAVLTVLLGIKMKPGIIMAIGIKHCTKMKFIRHLSHTVKVLEKIASEKQIVLDYTTAVHGGRD